MDHGNRSELLKTIESQQVKIKKYENKLRDLISAYRGVLTEKEALEASLGALSSVQPTRDTTSSKSSKSTKRKPATDGETSSEKTVESAEDTTEEDEEGEGERMGDDEREEEDGKLRKLQDQLVTLMSSMTTLTQEKSKMEANYQADKKTLRQNLETKIEELEAQKSKNESVLANLQEEMQQWKKRLREQQHERDKEQSDHAIMLRELQKLLGEERTNREQLESQVEELRSSAQDQQRQAESTANYEATLQTLRRENYVLKDNIRAAEKRAAEPQPLLLKLQEEIANIKAQHRIALHQEQCRSADSDEQRHNLTEQGESRVSTLEAKLSQLSEVTGNYERLRYQDQQTISKLRERVSQLDMENSALARATHNASDSVLGAPLVPADGDPAALDVQILLDRMTQLKGLLKLACEKADRPLDMAELLGGDLGLDVGRDSEALNKARDEHNQLKEDFERYKLRAQSVLKSKSYKDGGQTKEVEELRNQVTELKDRLRQLRIDYEEQETKQSNNSKQHALTIQALNDQHRTELAARLTDHKQAMGDLEGEIKKHRDRTISLLAEKDRELESMRMRMPDHYDSPYANMYRSMSRSSDQDETGASSEGETTVNELLTRTTALPGTPGETSLLHFAQEQARKEVEINNLRRQKHTLESGLRELQQSSVLKTEKQFEEINSLKEEVRKHERNQSRESANLEYLKNVVYHHLVSSDHLTKQQTMNAIATILQFSPHEHSSVQKATSRGWWPTGNTPPKRK